MGVCGNRRRKDSFHNRDIGARLRKQVACKQGRAPCALADHRIRLHPLLANQNITKRSISNFESRRTHKVHSLKSTAIAVVLLAVSIGLYQVSSTPDTTSGTDLTTQLDQHPQLTTGQPSVSQPYSNGNQFQQQMGTNHLAQPLQQLNQKPFPQFQQTGSVSNGNNARFASSQMPVMNNQIPAPNSRYTQQMAPPQRTTPQLAPPVLGHPQYRNPAPLQTANAPSANVQGLTAPSFEDLKQKFEQNSNANTISAAGNQLANDLAANLKPAENQLNQLKQSLPDLSQAKSAMVQAIDQTRDEGLMNALKSEFSGDNDAVPALSSAKESQEISIKAPTDSTFDAGPSIEKPTPLKIAAGGNEFMPNLEAEMQELKADSEFTATPIGSSNDSINSLASGHRSDVAELQVQQANMAPDSLSPKAPSMNLDAAWKEVDRLVADKKFRAALGLLTRYYRQSDLSADQSKRLHEWLDALAGKVIYSSEHHFQEKPYIIRSGETLNQIAGRWNVPAQVVYNVNRQQIGDSATIVAGTELKVINGPFHAEVDLSSKTLTLFLKNLYAGRFPIRVGTSGNASPGQFRVVAKSAQGHTWRDSDGNDFPPESSENGYGPYWVGLTGSLCLHAVDDDTPEAHAGCIGLQEKDARDIFGILINGSELKIVK